MSFTRPIQWYHSHADPIWPDGTFKNRNWLIQSEDQKGIGRFNYWTFRHLSKAELLIG
jgi:hypothetical protein